MSDCKSIIAQKFPNATMCVGFIGNTTNAQYASNITTTRARYASSAAALSVTYLDNLNVLIPSMFSSDGIHPNNSGQAAISEAIIDAMNDQLL